MVLRRLSVLGLVGLLALAGCSQSDPTLEQVEVTFREGQSPQITLPTTPFDVDAAEVRLVADGDGAALETGQGMLVREMTVSGADGSVLADTWAEEPHPGLVVGDNIGVEGLDQVLADAHVGAQVLIALPGTSTVGDPQPTNLFLLEVADVYDIFDQATGTPVPADPGLPVVTVDDDGVPTAVAASGTPPASLVVQPLIAGDGPVTAAGQTVTVHYTGWLWDGTQFDSSWDRGKPYSFELGGQVIAGWNEGVAGQPVGSRLLLIVPPDKGYGDRDQGVIPPGSTLVFVVDVLAAA